MLTSKGAAAVTGGGFITLAATLAATSTLPVAGLTLLIGVDRFMSEARAITSLIGNGVATMVMARWEGRSIAAGAEDSDEAAFPTPPHGADETGGLIRFAGDGEHDLAELAAVLDVAMRGAASASGSTAPTIGRTPVRA
jgi:aerobic C4-dicarboxylate transport protein